MWCSRVEKYRICLVVRFKYKVAENLSIAKLNLSTVPCKSTQLPSTTVFYSFIRVCSLIVLPKVEANLVKLLVSLQHVRLFCHSCLFPRWTYFL